MLLDISDKDCFFCEPEEWRIIYNGTAIQLLAGAGPLCPGYVMLAPKSHTHSMAELDTDALAELLAIFEILKIALKNQYGGGYTAYEHGRTGSCITLETRGHMSTFCHHAHRIIIPQSIELDDDLETFFEKVEPIDDAFSIREKVGNPYVFFESSNGRSLSRKVLLGPKNIGSQFMRRIISQKISLGRHWDWRRDIRYEEMIQTIACLRCEFIGIEPMPHAQSNIDARPSTNTLPCNLSIDGFTFVGKTTVARSIQQIFSCPVIDTGMLFRHMAYAQLTGAGPLSPATLASIYLSDIQAPKLRTREVTEAAHALALDPDQRRAYSELLPQVLRRLAPCIVVGRDAWRFMGDQDLRVVLEADLETRLKRKLLEVASRERTILDAALLAREMLRGDEADRQKLPGDGAPNIVRINNGRRPISSTIEAVLAAVRSGS